jgi:hypothetical protein
MQRFSRPVFKMNPITPDFRAAVTKSKFEMPGETARLVEAYLAGLQSQSPFL